MESDHRVPEGMTEPVVKKDTGKPRFDLLSPVFLEGMAAVMTFNVEKYEGRNYWDQHVNWSRYFSSCMRHLWKWWRGEDLDDETGLSHLLHAGCCVMILTHYALHKKYVTSDDRPQ